MTKKKAIYDREFTLFGDLDGLTVKEMKEILNQYNDTDVIESVSHHNGVYEETYFYFRESWHGEKEEISGKDF